LRGWGESGMKIVSGIMGYKFFDPLLRPTCSSKSSLALKKGKYNAVFPKEEPDTRYRFKVD
jgi:hypothetical protein